MCSIAWSPLRGRKLSKSKYSVWLYVYKLLRCANLHKEISVCLGRTGMVDYRCQHESSFLLSSFFHFSKILCCLPPLLCFFFLLIQGFTTSSSWLWTHSISQSNLKLAKRNPTASVFQVLELQSCTSTPSCTKKLFIVARSVHHLTVGMILWQLTYLKAYQGMDYMHLIMYQ